MTDFLSPDEVQEIYNNRTLDQVKKDSEALQAEVNRLKNQGYSLPLPSTKKDTTKHFNSLAEFMAYDPFANADPTAKSAQWRRPDGTLENITLAEWEERIQAERDKEEAAEKQRLLVEQCRARNIPRIFWYAELKDYKTDNNSQVDAVIAISTLMKTRQGKIILLGNYGLGKTMLASIAVKKLGGKILKMTDISLRIRKTYGKYSDESEATALERLSKLPFLAIDEIGRSVLSDAEHNWLSCIVDERYTRNLPTILISNLPLPQFSQVVGGDVMSRFSDKQSHIVQLVGEDYRKNQ